MLSTILAVNATALLGYMLSLWMLSLFLRDSSIADVGWGIGFLIVTWTTFRIADDADAARLILPILVTIWGLRLSIYLLVRRRGGGCEDSRYTTLRSRYRAWFPLTSLGIVFLFQGGLIWVVALPIQVAAGRPAGPTGFTWAGVALWLVGFLLESVGDAQLLRFKKDPANDRRIMDRGLWRYTRHPNYFGDFLVWWGVYLVALGLGATWWTIVGPLAMSMLLIEVSGVRLLEKRMGERAQYRRYAAGTSRFLPLPPRRSNR